ncbi:MAG: ATP-binding protein, partial [Melioribacteraceae bacterium]|nr:ATP-binding protein [Melioribacteraceae bacterium]
MIPRFYNLDKLVKKGKVLLVFGPRRVGKTTLLTEFLQKNKLKYNSVSGDNISVANILNSRDFKQILDFAEGYDIIAIDEAQQIKEIGMGLKILIDNNPELIVIATGSSSFKLSQQTGEPLTGRKRTAILFPIAQMELLNQYNKFELKQKLDEFLIYGSYPEIVMEKSKKEKKQLLREFVDSYLLKDIFALENLRSPKQLITLLKLLAFQIGSLVSLNELASQLRMDIKTVQRYLDILEKSFIIKSLGGFSRNLRNELKNKNKYYFWDIGIRNALINQFNTLQDRTDTGFLFENFIVMERIKYNTYKDNFSDLYFWRNYAGQEIDLIEER